MAMSPAEKQRSYRERLKSKPAVQADTSLLDALEDLVEAAYGRKFGMMDRRAMLDIIAGLRQ
jgi:hypothetical protein